MTDQERAAMQQALEAMLNFPDDISDEMFASIAALKAALAQEPTPPPEGVTEAEKTVYGAALQGGRLPRPEAAWRNVCSDVPQCPAPQPTIPALKAALAQEQTEPKPLHPEVRKMCEEYFDKCVEALLTFPVAPFKAQEPEPPPEAVTEAEKIAYAAGWWAAMARRSAHD